MAEFGKKVKKNIGAGKKKHSSRKEKALESVNKHTIMILLVCSVVYFSIAEP